MSSIILQGYSGLAAIDPPDSTHYLLAEAVRERIEELATQGALPGIDSDNVYRRKIPFIADFGSAADVALEQKTATLPAIVVCYGMNERFIQSTNATDDIGYPILVIVAAADRSVDENDNQQLGWRETIIREFRYQRFDVGGLVFSQCTVQPGPVIDWAKWASKKQVVTSCLLNFTTRDTRGN